ncbi:MAG TPA: hypothetical protein VGL91_23970 [Acidobacteriota bacterium]
MKNLHATPAYPNEVSSPRSLTFYVGNPPRQMQIFSGIAIPEWDSQKRLDYEEVLVHFNVPAPQGNYPGDWEYTATTSLASVRADAEEDFTFATEECSVLADENTGELLLYAKIAVLGEPAVLSRFSYHVEVLSKIPVPGMVLGSIRWKDFYGDPVTSVINGGAMFKVGPATLKPLPAGWQWDAQFTIETSVAPQHIGKEWVVPYSITGLPINKALIIVPDLLPGTLAGPPGPFSPLSAFAPPFYDVKLTTAAPSEVGLDFEMTFPVIG